MSAPPYEDCVFLNVPFDTRYEPFLRALVFTIHDCGLVARCAREIDDGGQVRLDTIYELILSSKYGVHDLSRTRNVRNWISNLLARRGVQIPGPSRMLARYQQFRRQLPTMCSSLGLEHRELIYSEYVKLVVAWLTANPWQPPAATAPPR